MTNRSLLSALAGGSEGWAVAFFGGAAEAQAALALASTDRRQLWCALWAQMSLRAERLDQADDIELWVSRLQSLSSRSLLQTAGFGGARGFRRSLQKLGWMALEQPEAYLSLADLLEDEGSAAKVIRHLETLDARAIALLDALPLYARSAKNLGRLQANRRVTPNMLRRQQWRIQRLRRVDPQASTSLQREFITSVLAEADGEFLTGLPFPAAPWPGNDQLTPIDSPAKLEAVARRYFNCLSNRMSQVRQGASYYYELNGIAVVEIESVSSIGWEIAEALGPRNTKLTPEELAHLRRALASAPAHIYPVLPDHLIG